MTSRRRTLFFLLVAATFFAFVYLPVSARAAQSEQPDRTTNRQGQASQSQDSESLPYGLTFIPFVLFSTRYDDNIFASTTNEPESDTILSLTPGFDMTYLSPRTNFNFNYNLTADKYTRHSQLSSWDEAQGGSIGVNHWFTDRFNAGIEGGYRVTHNPGQLSPGSGVLLARNRATQATIQPEIIYDFSPRTSMDVFYRRIRSDLAGLGTTKIGTASGTITHELTPRDALLFHYENIYYGFLTGGSASSNLFTLGWNHALSPSTNLTLSAGPRDTEGRIVPEILASLGYQSGGNQYTVAYQRTQTLIVGQSEVVDVQGLTASLRFAPNPAWSITFAPGYFHDDGTGVSIDVYHLGFYVWYRFARDWSLGLTEVYRLQHGAVDTPGNPTIRRNIIGISLRWGLPIQGGDILQGEEPLPLRGIENRQVPHPTSPGGI